MFNLVGLGLLERYEVSFLVVVVDVLMVCLGDEVCVRYVLLFELLWVLWVKIYGGYFDVK